MIHSYKILIIFILAAAAVHADQNQETAGSARPRLYFTPAKIAELKTNISANSKLNSAWEKLLENADRKLSEQLVSKEYAEGGSGQHGNFGRPSSQISSMASVLSLAYRVTGEDKYARKLKEAMLHYGKLSRWAGDAQRDPPWNSELNTARFCFGYAVGYDSICDYLTESERKEIAGAMIRLGILPTLNDWVLPEKRIHALDSMGHNWWSVCVAMAGVASLSLLDDDPRAQYWTDEIVKSFPEFFYYQGNVLQNKSVNFDSKGAFYESVSYANYALSEYLLFRLAYSNVYPEKQQPVIPILENVGDFFIHTSYPTSDSLLSVNFGDGSIKAGSSETLRLLLANGFDKDQYHWYINRTDNDLDDPLELVYNHTRKIDTVPDNVPCNMIYPDIGWAMMRSSWEDDATMLAVTSGFAWNHAHPDSGSFILFHKGKPLIIDSGKCSYSRREYGQYYKQSKAHNVITIDGKAQNPEDATNGDRGVVTPGSLHHMMDLAGIKYLYADAAGPTSWKFSRNYRHFLWVDDVILIFDDVRSHDKGQFEWLLHFEDRYEKDGSQIILSNGQDAKAVVMPMYPTGMKLTEKTGLKDSKPDTKVNYLSLAPEADIREAKFITAVIPIQDDNRKLPEIQLLEGDEMIGVKIIRGNTVTEIFINLRADGRRMHRNSNKVIQGWETDAYLFGITYPLNKSPDPENISRYFVACGSYLRKNENVVLHSLSKVYSIFSQAGSKLECVMQGQPIINASIHLTKKPEAVILNGRSQKVIYDQSDRCIKLNINNLY